MKKAILNRVKGLYYYYSSGGTAGIPYFSTICALTLVVIIHLVQAVVALNRFANINVPFFPMPGEIHKGYKYLLMALYLAPIFYFLTRIFPKKKIKFEDYEAADVRKYRYHYFFYLALNVLIIVFLVADKVVFRKQ